MSRPPALTSDVINAISDVNNLRELCVGLLGQRTRLLAERQTLRESLREAEARIANDKIEFEANTARNATLEAMIRDLMVDKEKAEALERENAELTRRLSEAGDPDALLVQIEAHQSESAALKGERADLRAQIEALTIESQQLKSSTNESLQALALARDEKARFLQESTALAAELADLRTRSSQSEAATAAQLAVIPALEEKVALLEAFVGASRAKEDDSSRQMSDLLRRAAEFDALKDRHDHLAAENAAMQSKITELSEYFERKESEPQQSELEALLAEKNKTIEKLKKLVQRSRKEDERKQQQINDLQAELESKALRLQTSATPDLLDTVAKLEAHSCELQQRLESSRANKDMEMENERLAKMLDKSHRLYASLLAQNQALMAEQARRTSTEVELVLESDVIASLPPEFRSKTGIKGPPGKGAPDEKKITDTYLKRVLLQFFLQDDATREELIPLILELVGCTEQHILAAQRQWQRSVHASPKTSGFFGL
jgi:chromosome segregation ATPase